MDCIFCRIDRPLFAETRLSFAFLDGFPVCNGHSLVVPKRHVVSLWEMGNDEYTDAFDFVRRVKDILHAGIQLVHRRMVHEYPGVVRRSAPICG
jgi:diadenosine tetraphosphate (Ap4A) HIT family hydrolase